MAHKQGEPWGLFNWNTLVIGIIVLVVVLSLMP